MMTYITNSHTMHTLMLNLGIVFKVEEHRPYRIYNEMANIAFLPCMEDIPDGQILYVIADALSCSVYSRLNSSDFIESINHYEK